MSMSFFLKVKVKTVVSEAVLLTSSFSGFKLKWIQITVSRAIEKVQSRHHFIEVISKFQNHSHQPAAEVGDK